MSLDFLLWQSYSPLDPGAEPRRAELTAVLARTVPLWKMQCTKEISAAETAYRAMGSIE